jgi:heme-degrading monooxygenase HmoA
MWRAQAAVEKADEYVLHATTKVFPALRDIEGHRGAYLLRHTRGNTVELVVLTLWESMDAARKFAGAEANRAVVEPDARAVLTSFDDFVTHFDVIHWPEMEPTCAHS